MSRLLLFLHHPFCLIDRGAVGGLSFLFSFSLLVSPVPSRITGEHLPSRCNPQPPTQCIGSAEMEELFDQALRQAAHELMSELID